MEAFSEAYHVIATHPQILEFCGDANSEYSIWPSDPAVTRFVNALRLAEPAPRRDLSEQQVAEAYVAFQASRRGHMELEPLEEGAKARQVVADLLRERIAALYRTDLSSRSDAELLDAILYHLFPAFAPWAGLGQSLTYRWRPGPTPDTCYMDVLRLMPGARRAGLAPTRRRRSGSCSSSAGTRPRAWAGSPTSSSRTCRTCPACRPA